jgi:hypothetical protein
MTNRPRNNAIPVGEKSPEKAKKSSRECKILEFLSVFIERKARNHQEAERRGNAWD